MLMPSIFGENLFDDFFNDFPFYDDNAGQKIEKKLYGRHGQNLMKTDIKEMEDGYELEMDLPGFKKEEIQAELKDGYLTICATHNDNKEQKDANGKLIRQERYTGSCKRSFYVGEDLKHEDIKASFENGILKLQFPKEAPKPVEEVPKYIQIDG